MNEAAGTANYSVAISGNTSASTVSVNYATVGGTAASGSDFTATSNTLSWTPGDTAAKPITVSINNDALDEFDTESFSVNLSGANGVTIGTSSVTTSITDNDAEPTTGAFASVSTAEGNAGSHEVSFTVNLSAVSGKPITVNYSTVDGGATAANNDYESEINQNVVIPAGQPSGTITITVNGDTLPESDETFTVNLNSVSNATLGADTQATGTITNDDSGVTASIGDATVTEGNSGTVQANFTVTLSSAAPAQVQLRWSTANGTAAAGSDFVGQTNQVLTIAQGGTTGQISDHRQRGRFPGGGERELLRRPAWGS